MGRILECLLCIILLAACTGTRPPKPPQDDTTTETADQTPNSGPGENTYNYDYLRTRVAAGRATLAEVRQALTERQAGGLTNTMHGLYSLSWHRGVINLLHDMWEFKQQKYPELAWDQIGKPPVRIALASTLNRIQGYNVNEYLTYIRSHRNDEHEFHRAQVLVALGLNGNPVDVSYIKTMADGDNHYVAQSAITALAMMGADPARDALEELYLKYRDEPRGKLIAEVLRQAYHLEPVSKKPQPVE